MSPQSAVPERAEAQALEAGQAQGKRRGKSRGGPAERFVLFVAFLGGILVLVDPAARSATGSAVGLVLEPLIGFGRTLPVLTVLLASTLTVVLTTVVRHYFTDYLKQARAQEVMRAFQREMRKARKEQNLYRMKRLTEKQKDLMSAQAELSTAQLKPMALTMIVVVPIFAWLFAFLDPQGAAQACESVGRVPWDAGWCMDSNIQAAPLTFLPRWIALYTLFSIPLGQLLGRALKARDLEAELARLPPGRASP